MHLPVPSVAQGEQRLSGRYSLQVACGSRVGLGRPQVRSRASENPIDLVLLDMNMVGIDGKETFRRLRDLSPNLPVLIYSGFAPDEAVTEMLKTGNCQFLRKPFPIHKLTQTILHLLESI